MFSLLYEDEGGFYVFCLFVFGWVFLSDICSGLLSLVSSILLTVISKQDRNLLEFLIIVI